MKPKKSFQEIGREVANGAIMAILCLIFVGLTLAIIHYRASGEDLYALLNQHSPLISALIICIAAFIAWSAMRISYSSAKRDEEYKRSELFLREMEAVIRRIRALMGNDEAYRKSYSYLAGSHLQITGRGFIELNNMLDDLIDLSRVINEKTLHILADRRKNEIFEEVRDAVRTSSARHFSGFSWGSSRNMSDDFKSYNESLIQEAQRYKDNHDYKVFAKGYKSTDSNNPFIHGISISGLEKLFSKIELPHTDDFTEYKRLCQEYQNIDGAIVKRE